MTSSINMNKTRPTKDWVDMRGNDMLMQLIDVFPSRLRRPV